MGQVQSALNVPVRGHDCHEYLTQCPGSSSAQTFSSNTRDDYALKCAGHNFFRLSNHCMAGSSD